MPDAPSPTAETTAVTIAAVIVAAGRGLRAGGGTAKQFRALAGRTVLDHAIAAFRRVPGIGPIVVVLPPDVPHPLPDDLIAVPGGETRAASVRAGLEALEGRGVARVLIHDAARATVPPEVIDGVLGALEDADAAAPGLPVTDALWLAPEGEVADIRPKRDLFRAQTPQGFRFDAILAAHRAHGEDAADDVEVARAAGLRIAVTPGHEDNLKITTAADFTRAERILAARETGMDLRIGTGFDVHAFGPGDAVILCGVRVPHDRGLAGHSDADVGMHALTDAILGALAEGDIGRHFPPSDPQWKGAASEIFLARAVEIAAARGFRLGNADVTLICERPKIGPHAAAMTAELERICGVEPGRIGVKATTSERLGFTGREEGIAAMASATMVRG